MFNTNLNECRIEIRRCIGEYYSKIKEQSDKINKFTDFEVKIELQDKNLKIIDLLNKYKQDEVNFSKEMNEKINKLIEDVNYDIKIIDENDFKVISEDIEVLTKAKEELEKEIVDISDEKTTITSLLKRYVV